MAKAKEQSADIELGGLPPELQVGEQTLPIVGQVDDKPVDTNTEGDGDEARLEEDADILPEGMISVVVTKGNTVRHDGLDYPENRTFMVSLDDANRLIGLGVVVDVEVLRKQALSRTSPAVSVKSGE